MSIVEEGYRRLVEDRMREQKKGKDILNRDIKYKNVELEGIKESMEKYRTVPKKKEGGSSNIGNIESSNMYMGYNTRVQKDMDPDNIRNMHQNLDSQSIRNMHQNLDSQNIRNMHQNLDSQSIRNMHQNPDPQNIRNNMHQNPDPQSIRNNMHHHYESHHPYIGMEDPQTGRFSPRSEQLMSDIREHRGSIRRFTGSTHSTPRPVKTSKTAIERLLEDYEKDIGTTLQSFELERNRQTEELYKLKLELDNYEKDQKDKATYLEKLKEKETKDNQGEILNTLSNERKDNEIKVIQMQSKISSLEAENAMLSKDMTQIKADVEYELSHVGSPRFPHPGSARSLKRISKFNTESDTVKNILSGGVHFATTEDEDIGITEVIHNVQRERDKMWEKYKKKKHRTTELELELNQKKSQYEEYKLGKEQKMNRIESELLEAKDKLGMLANEMNSQTETHTTAKRELENLKSLTESQHKIIGELQREKESLFGELNFHQMHVNELEQEYRFKLNKLDEEIQSLKVKEQQIYNREGEHQRVDEKQEAGLKDKLEEIFRQGREHFEGLQKITDLHNTPNVTLLGYVDRLLKHLITDKKYQEEKYNKLIDMHNQLLEKSYNEKKEVKEEEKEILVKKYQIMSKEHEIEIKKLEGELERLREVNDRLGREKREKHIMGSPEKIEEGYNLGSNIATLPPEVASLKDKIEYLERKVMNIEDFKSRRSSLHKEGNESFQGEKKFRPLSLKKRKVKGLGHNTRYSTDNLSFAGQDERKQRFNNMEKKKRSKSRPKKKQRETILKKLGHHKSNAGTIKFF